MSGRASSSVSDGIGLPGGPMAGKPGRKATRTRLLLRDGQVGKEGRSGEEPGGLPLVRVREPDRARRGDEEAAPPLQEGFYRRSDQELHLHVRSSLPRLCPVYRPIRNRT